MPGDIIVSVADWGPGVTKAVVTSFDPEDARFKALGVRTPGRDPPALNISHHSIKLLETLHLFETHIITLTFLVMNNINIIEKKQLIYMSAGA
jgi:hypothetical protein